MRVVLDTVILVRGLINPFSVWGRLVFDRAIQYQWVVSAAIEAEYLEVLSRPELVRKYRTVATRDLATIVTQLSTATVVEPSTAPTICRDPEDDKFLAAAFAGSVQCIVSEDLDLLEIGSFEGIPILNAESTLQLLEGNSVKGE